MTIYDYLIMSQLKKLFEVIIILTVLLYSSAKLNFIRNIKMEAIGLQVIFVLSPAIVLAVMGIWSVIPHFKRQILQPRDVAPQPAQDNPRVRENECPICHERKKYEVAVTCGHSFCGQCLLAIYEWEDEQIQCIVCRRIITTMIRSYGEVEGIAEERQYIAARIRRYNVRFEDNRHIFRRIREFPMVFRRLSPLIFTPRFLLSFFKSVLFLRFFMLGLFYLLLPFDLMPERFFGVFGLVDDILFGLILMSFAMGGFALMYIRRN